MDKFVVRQGKRKYPSEDDKKARTEDHGSIVTKQKRIENPLTELYFTKQKDELQWKQIRSENLDLQYCNLFDKHQETILYRLCEQQLEYNTGKIAQVQIFGKWLDIPRKQVAFGDPGLSYTFSGNTVPARNWLPFLAELRDYISNITAHKFNFVLINRYKDGTEYMGEHKDDERDLDKRSPIASVSLGQPRDFYFKHQDTRGKKATRKIDKVSMVLSGGSLLLMNYPTNEYWYHALPKRLKVHGTRINLTFRRMVTKS